MSQKTDKGLNKQAKISKNKINVLQNRQRSQNTSKGLKNPANVSKHKQKSQKTDKGL